MLAPMSKRLGLALTFGVWLLVGCSKKPFEAVASCDMRSESGDKDSELCMDLAVINAKAKEICDNGPYKWDTKPCSTKKALGGCRADNTITWYYPSAKTKKKEDVKSECGSDVFVGTDGKEEK